MTSTCEPLEITGDELVHILRTPRDQCSSAGCVVLDCRPFLDFSLTHICDSRNVNWNSMLRRRSKTSVVALEWLIPDKALLGRLQRGEFSAVVVVDENSRSVAELKPESVAQMLLAALQSEVHTQICFLQGGFERFSEACPELCYICASSLLSTAEPEPTGRKTPAYDQDGPVELLPFLFLGSAVHSSRRETLAAVGITALLNVSSTCPNFYEGEFEYLRLTVEDSLAADIGACFSTAIAFIDSVKQSGGRVLVHCHAGISRSATICLAYLMHTQRVRLDEAFDFVKQRRHVISPNLAFMGQLLQFETDVLCRG
ncbi:dual specificity phosphatase 2-like [Solea senegalensis]|uniref:Dual specificity protein phosphatase 2 n=1 Tax=Solea senegalensis TaxID=28829 RepID=A0AAV6QKJ4_SOLSE|nr:dual specificity protein phosphatase 2-like [Solea senegalensis]XP_043881242.1 dual specificity protein phosphatase 2 [Solea senegalensis]KAG7489966.1 dual specificity phosphatase 2-like [Solea senegalensis]KAG7490602.1 dual specificity phosphatase 2-like [Solea senegalensis]